MQNCRSLPLHHSRFFFIFIPLIVGRERSSFPFLLCISTQSGLSLSGAARPREREDSERARLLTAAPTGKQRDASGCRRVQLGLAPVSRASDPRLGLGLINRDALPLLLSFPPTRTCSRALLYSSARVVTSSANFISIAWLEAASQPASASVRLVRRTGCRLEAQLCNPNSKEIR